MNIPSETASRKDLGLPFDFDIPEDLSANFNVADLDIGMNDSLFPNNQSCPHQQ